MPLASAWKRHPALNPFETYIREINATGLLDAEQEQELACRIEGGDSEARDHMVRANLRLVINIARGYQGRGLPLEDLIAEGNLGLVRAVEGFDPALGVRFSTYASFWVKQSIKRALVNQAPAIRLPNYMTELLIKWRRATAELEEELGRCPGQEEVAARLGLGPKKLRIIRKALRIYEAGQLSDQGQESGSALSDLIADDPGQVPDARTTRADELRHVLGLLDRLGQREATVLRLRFGLAGEDPMSLQQVGDRLGLTRERVRQLEKLALRQLRECLEEGEAGPA